MEIKFYVLINTCFVQHILAALIKNKIFMALLLKVNIRIMTHILVATRNQLGRQNLNNLKLMGKYAGCDKFNFWRGSTNLLEVGQKSFWGQLMIQTAGGKHISHIIWILLFQIINKDILDIHKSSL